MKKVRLLVLVIAGLLIVGGALIYRNQQGAAKADAMREPAAQLVRQADIYRVQPEYVEGLFQYAHPIATKSVSQLVGAGFSEERYYTALFQTMVDRAAEDGQSDVARSLRTFAVGKNYVGVRYGN